VFSNHKKQGGEENWGLKSGETGRNRLGDGQNLGKTQNLKIGQKGQYD